MPDAIVTHPLGLTVVRAYLLSITEITAITGTRIATTMTKPFPSVRLTEITTTEIIPRVWTRMLVQADCWAATQPDADRLGRLVLGALRASANHVTADAVMGETQDLAVRSDPDSTLTPAQPRAIVTGHVWLRPS